MLNKPHVTLITLVLCLICAFTSSKLLAKSNSQTITQQKISESFYIVDFYGSKVGISIGDDGVLVVDTLLAKHKEALLATIRQLTDKPIKYVINTHADYDHTGGNALLAENGATIVMQNNALFSNAYGELYFDKKLELDFNNERIQAVSIPSHSFSDSLIFFDKSNLVFMGDILGNKSHPTFYAGGVEGMNNAFEKAMSLGDENTLFVSSHGYTVNRAKLVFHRDAVNAYLKKLKELYSNGITAAEELIKNPEIQRIVQLFNGENRVNNVNEKRLLRFIKRTIASELIPQVTVNSNLQKLEGHFKDSTGELFEVAYKENRLFLQIAGVTMRELVQVGRDDFHLFGEIPAELKVQIIEKQGSYKLYLIQGSDITEYSRI